MLCIIIYLFIRINVNKTINTISILEYLVYLAYFEFFLIFFFLKFNVNLVEFFKAIVTYKENFYTGNDYMNSHY